MLTLNKRARWVAAAIVLVAAGLLYFSTHLDTIVSSSDENLVDVGEIQIVLNNWGTLHHTGYPFYTILGAAFVHLANGLGFNPAQSPSLFSLFWALVTLALVYRFILDITGHIPASAAATMLMAVGFSFWINATIPEVYSLYSASIAAVLLLARRLSQKWSDKGFLGLALLLGLAGGHHRLAAFILPSVAIFLAPALWRQRRKLPWLLPLAGLLGAATFLVYLYLPLRSWQGADFVFGSPTTWDGFRRVFFGPGQVTSFGPSPAEANGYFVSRMTQFLNVLRNELTLVGLSAGILGLFLLFVRQSQRVTALALLLAVAGSLTVGYYFPVVAVAGNYLLPVVIAIVAGFAWLTAWLSEKRPFLGWIGTALILLISLWIAVPTYNRVQTINHPPGGGRQLLDIVAQIPPAADGPEPVLMIPWGNDYFLAYFARYISHELAHPIIVDHNANFRAYLAEGRPLYTLDSTFWRFPISWWESRLGHPYLVSATSNIIQLSDKPIVGPEDIPHKINTFLGDNISLVGFDLERTGATSLNVILFFQAAAPVSTDYSLTVRLTDQPEIDSPEDILAQQDRIHPVLGWNPTSRWLPGEIVRTFHHLEWDPAVQPTLIEITLYQEIQPGVFRNLEIVHFPIDS